MIEQTFNKKEGELYLACNDQKVFFTSADHYKGYKSNEKAMNSRWRNLKATAALKTKMGNNQTHKQTKYRIC